MSKANDAQLRRLFRRDLTRITAHCRQEGFEVMAPGPDEDLESYYTPAPTRRMSKADFETGGAECVEHLEEALLRLWPESDRPQLAALASKIARVARSVRATDEQSSELSQFVYVMY